MTEPLEYEYFQLINGKMYPAKNQKGELTRSRTALPDADLNSHKIGTVTPKSDTMED